MTVTNSPATTAYDNLVQLAHSLRPSWQTPGIQAAIREVCSGDRQVTFEALTFAVVAAALTPTIRTPAVIAYEGEHWPDTKSATIPPEWDWQPRQQWPNKTCGAGPARGPRCSLDAGHAGKCHLGSLNRSGFPELGVCGTCYRIPHQCTGAHPEDGHEFVPLWEMHARERRPSLPEPTTTTTTTTPVGESEAIQ